MATPSRPQASTSKPFPVITLVLIAVNCVIFVFPESWGRDPAVVYRYSMIAREVALGYKLTTDDHGCIKDATGLPDFHVGLPVFEGMQGGCCGVIGPHDVGCVDPENAERFRYRTISPWTTMFTSMFLHASWLHLLGNMVFLYVFGSIVESVLGRWKFLLLYIAAGLLSGLGSALLVWSWPKLGLKSAEAIIPSLGASGAIAGIIGSYLALHPKADIRVPVPIGGLLIPLGKQPGWMGWIFAGAWGGWEVYTAVTAGAFAHGANHLAHIAGFAAGILLVLMEEDRDAYALLGALYVLSLLWPIVREYFINRWGT